MYIEGKVEGIGEFLEVIKTNATTEGWEALRDEHILFDKIPSDLESIVATVDKKSIEGYFNGNKNGTAKVFTINLPYYLKPTAYMLKGGGTLKAEAKKQDLTTELLFESNTETENTAITTDEHIQYTFTITGTVTEFNLFFDTDITVKRELILYSKGFSTETNIYIGFKGFTRTNGAQNISISAFTGYADGAEFEKQSNYYPSAYIYQHEKEMKYWLNIDKQRVLGAFKIYEPTDQHEKNAVYQFLHAGFYLAYGMPSQMPAPYCLIAGGTDREKRWSDVNTDLPTKPVVFTPLQSYIQTDTLIGTMTEENSPYAADPSGELLCLPHSMFSTSAKAIFGEVDGFIKIVATNQSKSEDVVTIDGNDYVLIQNGKKLTLVDYFGVKK